MDHGIDDTLVSVAGIRCRRKTISLDIPLEVVALVVSGLVNKHVGGELGIANTIVQLIRQSTSGVIAPSRRFGRMSDIAINLSEGIERVEVDPNGHEGTTNPSSR